MEQTKKETKNPGNSTAYLIGLMDKLEEKLTIAIDNKSCLLQDIENLKKIYKYDPKIAQNLIERSLSVISSYENVIRFNYYLLNQMMENLSRLGKENIED